MATGDPRRSPLKAGRDLHVFWRQFGGFLGAAAAYAADAVLKGGV